MGTAITLHRIPVARRRIPRLDRSVMSPQETTAARSHRPTRIASRTSRQIVISEHPNWGLFRLLQRYSCSTGPGGGLADAPCFPTSLLARRPFRLHDADRSAAARHPGPSELLEVRPASRTFRHAACPVQSGRAQA